MANFTDIKSGVTLSGVLSERHVEVVSVETHADDILEIVYRDAKGRTGTQLLFAHDIEDVELVEEQSPWSFTAPPGTFKLASEAYRIQLAHLFDEHLAVHTSLIEPLPHQITAVYGEMLPRQPLRFLLADDPGAGKTIMSGLLIKELLIRGDVKRCMVVPPGNLVEQWQDEMHEKFDLPFDILTREKAESARSGNWFLENDLVICRLDQLARGEDLQAKLEKTEWDLIIVDEAHKMSAHYWGGEVEYTKRYRLGQLLSELTRHFLLMTATPHNGKEEDFQLFLSLLDEDRFEGGHRAAHDEMPTKVDTSDLMRRMLKEELLRFNGKPLFPERKAYTVKYELTDAEKTLYDEVTEYVRHEFNRAERLQGSWKGAVGFALTQLQRRLASSPEAIHRSIQNRRKRLETKLEQLRAFRKNPDMALVFEDIPESIRYIIDLEDIDELEEAPAEELLQAEEFLIDQATASQTIDELVAEITTLERLEALAREVWRGRTDRKWEELSGLIQNREFMFDSDGSRRKLVIFTEHRDTLNYLIRNITTLIGDPDAIVTIHGNVRRDERKEAEHRFKNDPDVHFLVATDAAAEGINLQRAHLMVNYDLPWNPNRIEQRFGRIHRIGQQEVCHLWNLVARDTREGQVFVRLLEKLDTANEALGGKVFDVLGGVTFQDKPLKELLIDAVRYGERPDVRAKLDEAVDDALDSEHLKELIEQHALAHETMGPAEVRRVREHMERLEARKLQPHFISAFFHKAFTELGGQLRERESKRWEVRFVPAKIRNRNSSLTGRKSILRKYERVAFEKEQLRLQGKPEAEFVCPGHPLLDTVVDIIVNQNSDLLKQGSVLIDPNDHGTDPRLLFYLEHTIRDGVVEEDGQRRIVSRRMQFVELDSEGNAKNAGWAPYLDFEVPSEDALELLDDFRNVSWLEGSPEKLAISHAISGIVPRHVEEVKSRRTPRIKKTLKEVHQRLTNEIFYWRHRAEELKKEERAGKQPKMNWQKAEERAEELQHRLEARKAELKQRQKLAPQPPIVLGGVLVIPQGLLAERRGLSASTGSDETTTNRKSRQKRPVTNTNELTAQRTRIERAAMEAVMQAERSLGFEPRDVGAQNLGYDVESRMPDTGRLRFIEVKGRTTGSDTVCVTKNEIMTGLNKPKDYILAIVEVDGDEASVPQYVRDPFDFEPSFDVTSVNFEINKLAQKARKPLEDAIAHGLVDRELVP